MSLVSSSEHFRDIYSTASKLSSNTPVFTSSISVHVPESTPIPPPPVPAAPRLRRGRAVMRNETVATPSAGTRRPSLGRRLVPAAGCLDGSPDATLECVTHVFSKAQCEPVAAGMQGRHRTAPVGLGGLVRPQAPEPCRRCADAPPAGPREPTARHWRAAAGRFDTRTAQDGGDGVHDGGEFHRSGGDGRETGGEIPYHVDFVLQGGDAVHYRDVDILCQFS